MLSFETFLDNLLVFCNKNTAIDVNTAENNINNFCKQYPKEFNDFLLSILENQSTDDTCVVLSLILLQKSIYIEFAERVFKVTLRLQESNNQQIRENAIHLYSVFSCYMFNFNNDLRPINEIIDLLSSNDSVPFVYSLIGTLTSFLRDGDYTGEVNSLIVQSLAQVSYRTCNVEISNVLLSNMTIISKKVALALDKQALFCDFVHHIMNKYIFNKMAAKNAFLLLKEIIVLNYDLIEPLKELFLSIDYFLYDDSDTNMAMFQFFLDLYYCELGASINYNIFFNISTSLFDYLLKILSVQDPPDLEEGGQWDVSVLSIKLLKKIGAYDKESAITKLLNFIQSTENLYSILCCIKVYIGYRESDSLLNNLDYILNLILSCLTSNKSFAIKHTALNVFYSLLVTVPEVLFPNTDEIYRLILLFTDHPCDLIKKLSFIVLRAFLKTLSWESRVNYLLDLINRFVSLNEQESSCLIFDVLSELMSDCTDCEFGYDILSHFTKYFEKSLQVHFNEIFYEKLMNLFRKCIRVFGEVDVEELLLHLIDLSIMLFSTRGFSCGLILSGDIFLDFYSLYPSLEAKSSSYIQLLFRMLNLDNEEFQIISLILLSTLTFIYDAHVENIKEFILDFIEKVFARDFSPCIIEKICDYFEILVNKGLFNGIEKHVSIICKSFLDNYSNIIESFQEKICDDNESFVYQADISILKIIYYSLKSNIRLDIFIEVSTFILSEITNQTLKMEDIKYIKFLVEYLMEKNHEFDINQFSDLDIILSEVNDY